MIIGWVYVSSKSANAPIMISVIYLQPPGFAQLFEDPRFCPQSTNCGVICGAISTTIPAEVIFLSPTPRIGRTDIVINICGAVADGP